ncbi:MAG: ABC transporter ATP-binding protein [Candidatus Lokiarchaeota archaeon]|nr:ABC transporter ATP-binding protein [Candidatus Lokiarchaeota archaeon]
MKNELLKIQNLTKKYISGLIRTKETIGVNNASFKLYSGEILSLVGESGSGKSTVANLILRFIQPTEGKIFYDREEIHDISTKDYYKNVQGIFQDPYSSFNYFYKIDHLLNQAFKYSLKGITNKRKALESTLSIVGLNTDDILGRFPHQISGGQLQRVLIARALLFKPKLIVADEPTSMIDSSSRADILNLFKELKEGTTYTEGMSIIFITHDIGQAQYLSDRVIVMKEGGIVEKGPTKDVFLNPIHPYTKNLLDCVPSIYRKQ